MSFKMIIDIFFLIFFYDFIIWHYSLKDWFYGYLHFLFYQFILVLCPRLRVLQVFFFNRGFLIFCFVFNFLFFLFYTDKLYFIKKNIILK